MKFFQKMRYFSQHFEFINVLSMLTILLRNEFSIFDFEHFLNNKKYF